MSQGKIIAIVGAPRSGKSFLAKKLAGHYGAKLFLEGEEGQFPKRIEEDIAQMIRPLERSLWFRTKLVRTYLEALALRDAGHLVVLDVFWVGAHSYLDATLEGFERELMWEVAALDKRLLGFPDLVVFLKISEAGIRQFLKLGGRAFDQSEAYLQQQILPVNEAHNQFFGKADSELKVLTVERDKLDFASAADLALLVQKINEKLKP